jgi:hypothetical protein
MRTIGVFIVVLILIPCHCLQEPMGNENNPADRQDKGFRFHISTGQSLTLTADTKKTDMDTNALKQSSWYSNAIKNILESEYEIKQTGNTNEFASPNRQQNLRAYYSADKFTLEPRADDNWKLQLTLKGIYSGKKKIYSPEEDAIASTNKNRIQFNHNKEFTVEYINSKEGVRQNFIIEKKPAGDPSSLRIKLQVNPGWFINKVHPKEIHFAKNNGNNLEKKLTYNNLKVWDAGNKELDASFSVCKNELSIHINTEHAVYPLTVDPLITGTNGTPDWIGDDANQPSSFFGYSVASAGDVNGDGYSDVIVGAYGYDDASSNAGRAFVYHGSSTGLSATPITELHDANQAGALFGRSVGCAGDVNGDGYSDVIIGADMYNDAPYTREGRVYIHYGHSTTGLSLFPDVVLKDADQTDAGFGWSVAGAGDVNGDGYSDVVVGAYNFDDGFVNEGKAFVYYGSLTGLQAVAAVTLADADQADAQFGVSVASAGDVNGDGYSDVVIGSHLYNDGGNIDEGRAFVYYGSNTGLSTSPLILSDADQASAQFGFSVACGGDVNGDGYSDVIVGANLYDDGFANEGVVFIYYGSSSGLSATHNAIADDANQANANFGAKIACAGDVNGDGYSDVIIGSYTYDDNLVDEGVAFVYYGSSSGLSASPDCMLDDANGPGASFGYSVASAGDVNGDGFSDVIIGAYTYNYMGNIDYGLSYVYHGGPDGLNTSTTWSAEGNQFGAQFGVRVSCAGDVNADGYSDVIIGAYGYDNGQPSEGVAFIYHGSASGINTIPAAMVESNQANANMGFSVAGAGDVNGDGYSDVIVGAYLYDNGEVDEGAAFIYQGSVSGINTTAAAMVECNQANANMGFSVAGAGDVNGDGYSDIVVGAWLYGDGQTDEGAAFIYNGSASGINTTAAATLESNQASAFMGFSVASAGDVNGDGYSDVIIGAWQYDDGEADEGVAFIYNGSGSGINTIPAVMLESNQASFYLGYSVASAGDVNGDGYGDVIVGVTGYDNGQTDEGAAFIYHGSATGINLIPAARVESDQANARMGNSVACAGDVNGDGYSDVIVGGSVYTNGQPGEGAAFVYYGSITGINTIAAVILEANQAFAQFGVSVASAGDVNGDGYSDVIVGAWQYSNGQGAEGAAFIYHGNRPGNNLRNNLRLYNSDLITPIQQSNMSDPNLFGAGLYAKSFIGKQKGKMVWETVWNGQPFSGNPITNSVNVTSSQPVFLDLGLTGTELKHQIAKLTGHKATYIRVRVKYDPVTAITGQVYGPWRYPEGYLRGRRDVGAVALPVKFIAFNVLKQDKSALLKWITTDEERGVQFEVQHSTDGINFTNLVTINGKNQTQNEYEWLHANPAKGNNFYRIKAAEDQKTVYTTTRKLYFSEAAGISIYPNPIIGGQLLTIKNDLITANQQVKISFINSTGQLVGEKEMVATLDGSAALDLQDIPAGAYLLVIQTGKGTVSKKIIVAGL